MECVEPAYGAADVLPLPARGERVGVRGPFLDSERHIHRSDSRRGPLTRIAARSDLSPRAGRGTTGATQRCVRPVVPVRTRKREKGSNLRL
jgi:hypothetical protein